MAKTESTRFPRGLHAPTGRPGLFGVQRDWAAERGDAAGVMEAQRAAELWNRSPEEWELDHVDAKEERWPIRITIAEIQRGDWININGQQLNAEALRRGIRHLPTLVRFFEALGLEIRHAPDAMDFDVRPVSPGVPMLLSPPRGFTFTGR